MDKLLFASQKRALALLLCLATLFCLAAFSPSASAAGWTNVVDVIAGDGFTVGLRSDGTALFAGDDADMARALASWNGVVRMEKKGWSYVVGYRSDGSVCVASHDPWGYGDGAWTQTELSGWKGITDLQPEYAFCAGLRSDGTVVLLSRDPEVNRYMNGRTASWQNITQICTGYFGILGLRRDGVVEYAGTSREDEEESWGMDQFPGLQNVRSLVAGAYGPYAILNDGSLVPSSQGFDRIEKLYFASDSMFGLRSDGTVAVYCGYEDPRADEVASWRNVVELGFTADGWARYVPTALLADGTVRAVTRGYEGEPYGEWDVSGWRDVVKLFSGSYYTVGLRADGTLLVTGGEFGSFDFLSQLRSWRNITRITASTSEIIADGHIVGLRADGTVVAAGNNSHGQCNVY